MELSIGRLRGFKGGHGRFDVCGISDLAFRLGLLQAAEQSKASTPRRLACKLHVVDVALIHHNPLGQHRWGHGRGDGWGRSLRQRARAPSLSRPSEARSARGTPKRPRRSPPGGGQEPQRVCVFEIGWSRRRSARRSPARSPGRRPPRCSLSTSRGRSAGGRSGGGRSLCRPVAGAGRSVRAWCPCTGSWSGCG